MEYAKENLTGIQIVLLHQQDTTDVSVQNSYVSLSQASAFYGCLRDAALGSHCQFHRELSLPPGTKCRLFPHLEAAFRKGWINVHTCCPCAVKPKSDTE